MKLLHTSDWHLGHQINGHDRSAEHAAIIESIVKIAENEQPDLFLLCGDLFHTAQPSASQQRILTEALIRLRRACPDMTIVTIAGNHDSSAKHDIFRSPWQALDVYTFGVIDRGDPTANILEIPGKGFVVAIPYTHPRNMPEGLYDTLRDALAERNAGALPVILAMHTTVAGCDFTGHDNSSELTVGGLDAVCLDELGSWWDYLALGHIHRPQTLRGSGNKARYSGSPLAVSFDETYPHSVSIVQLSRHGELPIVTDVEIPQPRPLVTLPADGFATWSETESLLTVFPDDLPAYLRLNVADDGTIPPDAAQRAELLCSQKQALFCRLNVSRQIADSDSTSSMTVDELRQCPPLELARMYAADTGQSFTDEMEDMLSQAIELVEADTRES